VTAEWKESPSGGLHVEVRPSFLALSNFSKRRLPPDIGLVVLLVSGRVSCASGDVGRKGLQVIAELGQGVVPAMSCPQN